MKNILVAEDDRSLRDGLVQAMSRGGYNVHVAQSGKEALDKIEKQVANSVHGVREFGNGCKITAVTLGTYPEIILHHMPMELAEAKKQADKGAL